MSTQIMPPVAHIGQIGDDELLSLRAERKAITAEMARLSNFIDSKMAELALDGHFRTVES